MGLYGQPLANYHDEITCSRSQTPPTSANSWQAGKGQRRSQLSTVVPPPLSNSSAEAGDVTQVPAYDTSPINNGSAESRFAVLLCCFTEWNAALRRVGRAAGRQEGRT